MTTAREIITSALTFRLNRLSAGETLDDDTAALCLSALNDIADEWSGSSTMLWREFVDSATVTGITGTIGTTWPNIEPGQDIDGATYNNGAGDFPISRMTMAQYHEEIRIKGLATGFPRFWAYDGQSTVYFYPACTGQTIGLRTRQSMQDFASLDASYVLPQGYRSALADVLAERVAPSLVGAVPADVARAAKAARNRIAAQVADPAIIGTGNPTGNILTGWR